MKAWTLLWVWMALMATGARAEASSWAGADVRDAVAAQGAVVVHVVVPLCSDAQIVCGRDAALGRPGDLRTNLYWGALYGARRFLAKPRSGWTEWRGQVAPEGALARAVFHREVAGEPWGIDRTVDVVVVLDAYHGDRIDRAVARFFEQATEGGPIAVVRGDATRHLAVSAVGYAGHNRLMDGMAAPEPRARGQGVPSFVLACASRSYFAAALRRGGSTPIVTTETLMAPEGYLIDAIALALGRGLAPQEVRSAAVAAYAKWQRLSPRAARRVFVPAP